MANTERQLNESLLVSLVIGVDGCRAGWLAAIHDLERDELSVAVYPTFSDLLSSEHNSDVIAIDIPIGLSESEPRAADLCARQMLGSKGSSVFPAPCRASLGGTTYEAASALSFSASEKKLSKQTYAILDKVRQVDDALTSGAHRHVRIVETHPEICFAFLNSNQPIIPNKKSDEGRRARLAVLPQAHRLAFDAYVNGWKRKEVAIDDILDALAAAWTAARVFQGIARSFPPAPDVFDALGIPMRIYA